ncbi:DsbA family oxidoreductase [Ensifer soli]|uniref:DsbA family oxidoreductase n=1 Tax=Ciceribacter sp. sgz301302 TaxID=3342379 RepID=UPI0035B92143
MKTLSIDVVSDVVCPWCYLGKARLDRAVAALSGEVDVRINWHPYQLDPDLPPEGVDHKAHLAAKLGGTQAVDRAHAMLQELGRADGIAFDFDAVRISPNTLDAHRLIRWAATGGPEAQDRVVSLLFKANFEEGRNVGDRTVLLDIAETAGLERQVIETLLLSEADKADILAEIDAARQMGVTGVPCFILDRRFAVMGAQSTEVLVEAIHDAANGPSDDAG